METTHFLTQVKKVPGVVRLRAGARTRAPRLALKCDEFRTHVRRCDAVVFHYDMEQWCALHQQTREHWLEVHSFYAEETLRPMTALVRYRIRRVAELNHWVRGFDAGRQERRQEHERAFDRLALPGRWRW
jgi:hypothetical protein